MASEEVVENEPTFSTGDEVTGPGEGLPSYDELLEARRKEFEEAPLFPDEPPRPPAEELEEIIDLIRRLHC